MARRIYGNGMIASVASVQTVEAILGQMQSGFQPKQDPFAELSREIEKCSRKIWQCVGDKDSSHRQTKKPRTNENKKSSSSQPVKVASQLSAKSPTRQNVPKDQQLGSNGLSRFKFETELNAMKYQDLKNECKKYGLKCGGTKGVLRERLLCHVFEDLKDTQASDDHDPMQVEEDVKKPFETVDKASESDVENVKMKNESFPSGTKEEAVAPVVEPAFRMEPARVSCSSMQVQADGKKAYSPAVEPMEEEEKCSKDPPGKPTSDTQSVGPMDTSSKSPLPGFMKDALKSMAQSAANPTRAKDSIPEDDISPPPSDFTSSSSSSKIGPRVQELISSLSNQSSTSNSALSKSVQAKKEARLARMAEMREKSQQAKMLSGSNSGVAATKEYSSSVPSLNSATAMNSGAKKNLAAQMREKALRKENVPANHNFGTTSSSSAVKRAFPLSHAMVPDSLGTTLKSGLGSTLKYGSSASKQFKASPRPLETYEISDREDSDSDDSETENKKAKKNIPSWATREKLLPALQAQYNGHIEGQRIDPDLIFTEVESCNLEAIFGNKMSSKYRTRTSSGNWSRDHVTAAEKLVYKREMGFASSSMDEI